MSFILIAVFLWPLFREMPVRAKITRTAIPYLYKPQGLAPVKNQMILVPTTKCRF